ncbi:hypothetical protein NKG05_29730 [Oerskovia sp. M15]
MSTAGLPGEAATEVVADALVVLAGVGSPSSTWLSTSAPCPRPTPGRS